MRFLVLLFGFSMACSTPAPEASPEGAEAEKPAAEKPSAETKTAGQADSVSIHGGWVRAVPPGTGATAAFGEITNAGSVQVTLVGASSAIAETVELHTHVKEGDSMKMRPVKALPVEGGGHLHLEPGGDHIMLLGVSKEPSAGDTVAFTLNFSDGSSKEVSLPVRSEAPGTGHAHPH